MRSPCLTASVAARCVRPRCFFSLMGSSFIDWSLTSWKCGGSCIGGLIALRLVAVPRCAGPGIREIQRLLTVSVMGIADIATAAYGARNTSSSVEADTIIMGITTMVAVAAKDRAANVIVLLRFRLARIMNLP